MKIVKKLTPLKNLKLILEMEKIRFAKLKRFIVKGYFCSGSEWL